MERALRITRAFNGGVTYADLMASRRLFGIAEGMLEREKLLLQQEAERQASADWFGDARQSEGVSV